MNAKIALHARGKRPGRIEASRAYCFSSMRNSGKKSSAAGSKGSKPFRYVAKEARMADQTEQQFRYTAGTRGKTSSVELNVP
jgi:hypothetical protein